MYYPIAGFFVAEKMCDVGHSSRIFGLSETSDPRFEIDIFVVLSKPAIMIYTSGYEPSWLHNVQQSWQGAHDAEHQPGQENIDTNGHQVHATPLTLITSQVSANGAALCSV